jgi:hypothetical protein
MKTEYVTPAAKKATVKPRSVRNASLKSGLRRRDAATNRGE